MYFSHSAQCIHWCHYFTSVVKISHANLMSQHLVVSVVVSHSVVLQLGNTASVDCFEGCFDLELYRLQILYINNLMFWK